MDNYRTVVIALILVSLLSFPARAQGIPGRWEKVEALKLGSPITVELKNGDRLGGQFEELSPSELLLRTNSAQAAIPRAEIDRIITRGRDDLLNGYLIGTAIGGGTMTAVFWPWSGDWSVWGTAIMGLAGAGLGGLLGIGVDAWTETEVVLYRAR